MAGISLRINGAPDGQKRPRVFTNIHSGRTMAWSPKSAWAQNVLIQAKMKRPRWPLQGPLDLDLTFWLPRPKSRPNVVHCDRKPDFDNIAKSVCDALTRAGWWTDDSRIVRATVRKLYENGHHVPGVMIDVEEIECE